MTPLPAASERQRLGPLTSVAVVLRCCSAELEALPHVVSLISSFLDFATPKRWSIERACERGLRLRMLRRLTTHEAIAEASGSTHPMDPLYRAYLASKGLVAAVRNDDLDVVRWICCEYCPHVVPVKAMMEAAKLGRLRVLQWLFERYPSVQPSSGMMDHTARFGALSVLQFLISRAKETYLSVKAVDRLLSEAVKYRGKVEIVRWLLHERRNLAGDKIIANNPALLIDAIKYGHFEVAKLLVEQGCHLDSSKQVEYVRRCVDLEMVKWLHTQQLTSNKVNWINLAADAGDLSVIKWVHENISDSMCSTDAMDRAALNGHLEVFQWLHANRTEGCTTNAVYFAAYNGHLKIVQWLHKNRTEGYTTNAMDYAAQNGHFDVVQWLHANRTEGCTTNAMDDAAESGHFEIIKWLHQHRTEGCTPRAMDYAAENGHLDAVQWLHENRPEGCTEQAMDLAAENGHLDVVKWLHENRTEGCTTYAMDEAGSIEVLQWLHEHRSEGCTGYAMVNAARSGNFEKFLYLKEHHLDVGVDEEVMKEIGRSYSFEIFEWLHVNYPEHFASKATTRRQIEGSDGTGRWRMYFQFESTFTDP